MALTWGSFQRPVGSKMSDVLEYFLSTTLPTLTYWQIQGGGAPGATTLFDGGKAGGLLERVSDSLRFAWYYAYDPSGVQTDKFNRSILTGTDHTPRECDLSGLMMCACDLDKDQWADKTAFLGVSALSQLRVGPVASGPFQAGETLTIDAGGLGLTCTCVDHITELDILMVEGLSATWPTTIANLSVAGGTSGASATIQVLRSVIAHHRADPPTVYDLRAGGGTFPTVAAVLTGATSGHTATVAGVNEATGQVTVSAPTGRFRIGETVSWNAGAETITVAWAKQNFRVYHSVGLRADYTVDDQTILYGEDTNSLLLLIPDPTNQQYIMFGAGRFVESMEGGGAREVCLSGTAEQVRNAEIGGGDDAAFVFTDHNGVPYAARQAGASQEGARAIPVGWDPETVAGATVIEYWHHDTASLDIERPIRPALFQRAFASRQLAVVPAFVFLPAGAWKTVSNPGIWANKAPLALALDASGFSVQFNDDTITP